MITKIQGNQSQQPAFTANWKNAREVIKNLPQEHAFFKGLNYTLDNKTIATKDVLLARLDKFAEEIKSKVYNKTTFNLEMPDFSNFFKNPKKFWGGLRELIGLSFDGKAYRSGDKYPFLRTIMHRGEDRTTLTILENDSVGDVANLLLKRGPELSSELKKARLENPKEISI